MDDRGSGQFSIPLRPSDSMRILKKSLFDILKLLNFTYIT